MDPITEQLFQGQMLLPCCAINIKLQLPSPQYLWLIKNTNDLFEINCGDIWPYNGWIYTAKETWHHTVHFHHLWYQLLYQGRIGYSPWQESILTVLICLSMKWKCLTQNQYPHQFHHWTVLPLGFYPLHQWTQDQHTFSLFLFLLCQLCCHYQVIVHRKCISDSVKEYVHSLLSKPGSFFITVSFEKESSLSNSWFHGVQGFSWKLVLWQTDCLAFSFHSTIVFFQAFFMGPKNETSKGCNRCGVKKQNWYYASHKHKVKGDLKGGHQL